MFRFLARLFGFGRAKCTELDRWQEAETVDVTRPRDPRAKSCLANLGKQIWIIYKGQRRLIVPQRVYRKPKFKKTSVEALTDGEVKSFDIAVGRGRCPGRRLWRLGLR